MVEKTTVYALPVSSDGYIDIMYYLTEDEADEALNEYESSDYGYIVEDIEPIETYVGSNIYKEAKKNK